MKQFIRALLVLTLTGTLATLLGVLAQFAAPALLSPTAVAAQEAASSRHPLDPLTAEEIEQAIGLLRACDTFPEKVFFPSMYLEEPTKEVIQAYRPGQAIRRRASACVFDRKNNRIWDVVVDLTDKKIAHLREVKLGQPGFLLEEMNSVPALVKSDPRWKKALARRGLTELQMEEIELHPWLAGVGEKPGKDNARLYRVLAYHRAGRLNPYPHVIEGVLALVDITAGKVVEVVDREPVIPVPQEPFEFLQAPKRGGSTRPRLKPLVTTQPEGPGYELHGQEVRWQNWRFRFSLHPREGLVLHTVGYQDGDTLRSVLYRGSLAEMVVPYGDPSEGWHWRAPFDAGEYGMGTSTTVQRRGHEVPAHARLFSAHSLDQTGGKANLEKDVVALWEQDAGLLWMHAEAGEKQTRRARQLCLQAIYVLGNYDYVHRWVFHLDGTLEMQMDLTGVVLVKGVSSKTCPTCTQKPDDQGVLRGKGEDRHGVLVARQIVATNHQHLFCFRLDLDVDGASNSLHELQLVREAPTRDNPAGNGFLLEQRLLRTEREASRPHEGGMRAWKVLNPNHTTALGHHPAYKLEPGPTMPLLAQPGSRLEQRAAFTRHPIWATRYRSGEKYPAGKFVTGHPGGEGLPRFVEGNASLVNEDLVLWHTIGMGHASRPEEWPVMPAAHTGFKLVPDGFFTRNPALDVPPAQE